MSTRRNRDNLLLAIPAAGKASRALALTAYGATMKCFVNGAARYRTVLEELVDEAWQTGITDISVILKHAQDRRALETFFRPTQADPDLKAYLQLKKKTAELERIAHLGRFNIGWHYQRQPRGFGHAVSLVAGRLRQAEQAGHPYDAVAVGLGDDLVFGPVPGLLQAVQAWRATGSMIVCVQQVSRELATHYGVILVDTGQGDLQLANCQARANYRVVGIEEKPKQPQPNRFDGCERYFAVLGRYVLRTEDIRYLARLSGEMGREVDFTPLFQRNIARNQLIAQEINGRWFTVGSPLEAQKTAIAYALGQFTDPDPHTQQDGRELVDFTLEILQSIGALPR